MSGEVTLLLIRHCSAGDRGSWAGDDRERPLDRQGRAQAEALVGVLRQAVGPGLTRILSSPYLRCRQSVMPLSRSGGVPIEVVPALAEGSLEPGMRLLRSMGPGRSALCSHGDVLPGWLRRLAKEDGLAVPSTARCEKGSVWIVSGPAAERFTSARYLPPPR